MTGADAVGLCRSRKSRLDIKDAQLHSSGTKSKKNLEGMTKMTTVWFIWLSRNDLIQGEINAGR